MRLGVLISAAGVYAGYPLAGPLLGLIITVVILDVVRRSLRVVVLGLLDGVAAHVIDRIRAAAARSTASKRSETYARDGSAITRTPTAISSCLPTCRYSGFGAPRGQRPSAPDLLGTAIAIAGARASWRAIVDR